MLMFEKTLKMYLTIINAADARVLQSFLIKEMILVIVHTFHKNYSRVERYKIILLTTIIRRKTNKILQLHH